MFSFFKATNVLNKQDVVFKELKFKSWQMGYTFDVEINIYLSFSAINLGMAAGSLSTILLLLLFCKYLNNWIDCKVSFYRNPQRMNPDDFGPLPLVPCLFHFCNPDIYEAKYLNSW